MAKKPEDLFNNEETEEYTPEWSKGLSEKSIENMLKQPEILPQLKPKLNAKYTIKILSLPRKITSKEYGDSLVMDIEEGDLKQSLFVGESIRLNLEVYRRRNDLKEESLIGKTFILQKVKAQNKSGQEIQVFLVQFK